MICFPHRSNTFVQANIVVSWNLNTINSANRLASLRSKPITYCYN